MHGTSQSGYVGRSEDVRSIASMNFIDVHQSWIGFPSSAGWITQGGLPRSMKSDQAMQLLQPMKEVKTHAGQLLWMSLDSTTTFGTTSA